MSEGLLSKKESIRIRLGPNKEILTASDPVFEPQHQEEARLMIYESEYLHEYLDEFSSLLMVGKPQFVTVTEPGRQTAFRYNAEGEQAILLTRAHRGIDQVLSDLK